MSRQLVQSVKRRRTAHRKRQRFGLRINQPRPAGIGPIALTAKDNQAAINTGFDFRQ
jgi:hypothetical protein